MRLPPARIAPCEPGLRTLAPRNENGGSPVSKRLVRRSISLVARKGETVILGSPTEAAARDGTPWRVSGKRTDFFISHAGRDTAWAEWLAWQLQQAGYGVELDVWDWAPGEDFVARMHSALERADRVLVVCTEAYLASAFGGAELRATFAQQALAEGRIVPVLVEPVTLPPLYAPLIPLDLTGLDEAAAAARLRARLTGGRPTGPPPFPHPKIGRASCRERV